MSIVLALALAASPVPIFGKERCVEPKTDEDIGMCEWLQMIGLDELRTVESVGVGNENEIEIMRDLARDCGHFHRIDYVGQDVAVVDIINAEEKEAFCFRSWIRSNAPHLEFSEQRLSDLVQAPKGP